MAGAIRLGQGDKVSLRYIDWIWQVRGSVELPHGQSSDEAFARLDPLFDHPGTRHERAGDRLTFEKQDPAAQDKMSVFDAGVLEIERAGPAPVLRYWLNSRILLFCFVLPLFFLGVAQLTIEVARHDKPPAEDAAKDKKKVERQMHPIDKFLGAPEPEKKDKPKTKAEKAKEAEDKKKLKPTPSYVFAGIFAALYVIGRLLEAWLVNRLFRNRLQGA
jgi:hypothetical protein